MSVNDPGVTYSRKVTVDGKEIILERRLGVIADNLLDASARRYAVAIRTGQTDQSLPPMSSYTLARDLTRIR